MATIWTHKESNIRKTWMLISIFLMLIVSLGWVFSQVYNNSSILVFAFLFSIFMSVSSYWWSDKIVVATTGAKPASEEQYHDLHNLVENLAITAGLPKPKIYIVDSPQPNAFATGRNAEHALVAVTTGLLNMMERPELEGVLAHEMSHIGNQDMLVSTVVVVLVGAVQLLSDFMIRSTFYNRGGDREKSGGPILLLAIVLAILAPIAGVLIQLAVSRKREFLADASGALLTRNPEGLVNALQKLAIDNTPMRQANHATAHLWLDDPFQGKEPKVSWLTKMFMTHPPIGERIQRLRDMGM